MIAQTVDGEVREIRLQRPTKRNALTRSGLEALRTAVEGADESVVYLTGDGPAFCAGADLGAVAALADADEARAFAELGQAVADALASTDSVVVAGIDGAARGGGVELALACDLRVATDAATFAEPGVEMGLFGAWGGTVRLPAVVGLSDAMDLALSGRVVDATEARRMGLVSRVVSDPRTVAEEVARHDGAVLATLKERLRDDAPRPEQERREAAAFAELATAAGIEGTESDADRTEERDRNS